MKRLAVLLLGLMLATGAYAIDLDLRLKDPQGKEHTLAEYIGKGKWVVLSVWSPGCPFCRQELPDFVDFHNEHQGKDAIVLGLVMEFPSFAYPEPAAIRRFLQDYFIDFPNLLVDQNLASAVTGTPITSLPVTFVFRPDGTLLGRRFGVVTREQLEQALEQ